MSRHHLSRRSFLAAAVSAAPLASIVAAKAKKVPVGLELYSVRDQLAKDLNGTVTKVAKMGYDCVEFYSPYMKWTAEQADQLMANFWKPGEYPVWDQLIERLRTSIAAGRA